MPLDQQALESLRRTPDAAATRGAAKSGGRRWLVAGKIAAALKAEKLILLTDVEGVMDERHRLTPTLNAKQAKRFITQKVISSGMIPKVNCCLGALEEGVAKTHIIDGRVEHAILLEIFTDVGIGTEIYKATK